MPYSGRGAGSLRGSNPRMTVYALYRDMCIVTLYCYYHGINCRMRAGRGVTRPWGNVINLRGMVCSATGSLS